MKVAVTLQCFLFGRWAVAVEVGAKHTCVVCLWWIFRAWQADTDWPQALLSDFDAQGVRKLRCRSPQHGFASSHGAASRAWVCAWEAEVLLPGLHGRHVLLCPSRNMSRPQVHMLLGAPGASAAHVALLIV